MKIVRYMETWIDDRDESYLSKWLFDTEDPAVYKVLFPPDNVWFLGRELFREALEDNKLGGRMDVLIIPPFREERTGIYLRGMSDKNIETASILHVPTSDLRLFHEYTHELVSTAEETMIIHRSLERI